MTDPRDEIIAAQNALIASLKRTIMTQEALLAQLREVNGHLKNEVALQEQMIAQYKVIIEELKRMDPLLGVGAKEYGRD